MKRTAPQNNTSCLRAMACSDDAGNARARAFAMAVAASARMIISRLTTGRQRASRLVHELAVSLPTPPTFFDFPVVTMRRSAFQMHLRLLSSDLLLAGSRTCKDLSLAPRARLSSFGNPYPDFAENDCEPIHSTKFGRTGVGEQPPASRRGGPQKTAGKYLVATRFSPAHSRCD